jgi:hypothetical protein
LRPMATTAPQEISTDENPSIEIQSEDPQEIISEAVEYVENDNQLDGFLLSGYINSTECIGPIWTAILMLRNEQCDLGELSADERSSLQKKARELENWEYKGNVPDVDPEAVRLLRINIQELGRLLQKALANKQNGNSDVAGSKKRLMALIEEHAQRLGGTTRKGAPPCTTEVP